MPKSWRRATGWLLVVLCAPVSLSLAQNAGAPGRTTAAPEIVSVLPPAVTVGQSAECTVTGSGLHQVESWLVSGSGVEVRQAASSDKLTISASADAQPGFRELRCSGPSGVSNLVVIRVDSLTQALESEPNDQPDQANALTIGSAAAGVLKAQDVDYFRVEGRSGQRIAIDLEARRLGTSIMPVVTVLTAGGAALAQGRETPGAGEDPRLAFTFPADGSYLIEVRDNMFQGADNAVYRLRLDPAPFATALFPLGGPKGQAITVTASGGTLAEPLARTITLPDQPGTLVELDPFVSPGGTVLSPGRLVVGDGPEIMEPAPSSEGSKPCSLSMGTTVNGRIEHPGEVDRYALPVKKGELVHLRVQAAPLGSWLDSVVALRDEKGNLLAENDDPGNPNAPRRAGVIFGISDVPADSRLDYGPKADGTVIVEVTDRYGDGGPEYGYRLDADVAQPDFAIHLLLVNPGQARQVVAGQRVVPAAPGSNGAFNLRPGGRVPVNFLITPEGFTGDLEVRAEKLPPGVTATPVKLRVTGPANRQPLGGLIELRAESDAEPALGELHVVATGTTKTGEKVSRLATAQISFPPLAVSNPRQAAFGTRIVTRAASSLPVAIVQGAMRNLASKRIFGPPRPVSLSRAAINVPGPLLQGGRLELALTLIPPNPPTESFRLEAEVSGSGVITQTVVHDEETVTDDGSDASAIVRLQSAVDAPAGQRTLTIRVVPQGGKPSVREVPMEVRAPIRLEVATGAITLKPGGTATLLVTVKRERGFGGPVDVKLEELPRGVKAAGRMRLASNQDRLEARLEMDGSSPALAEATPVRVVAVVRMPRGPVRVESANRPMVMSPRAEK